MATIYPFRPYRYTAAAGALDKLVTQPYDKISPAMQAEYLAASPHNLVRVLLGERHASDNETENVYTRAAAYLKEWIGSGVLAREDEPSLFAYFQEFVDPDTGARTTRKGFVGVCQIEEYAAGVVHRHEQTLSGPKKDRLELLRHTEAHFGQIFMLYPDPAGAIDRLLDEAAAGAPTAEVTDHHYDVIHRVWKIAEPERVAAIQKLMADKKLVIADGHHRYETALAYSKENPKQDAQRVMMTFVNMHSPGLRILATHRVLRRLDGFDVQALRAKLEPLGRWTTFAPAGAFKTAFANVDPGKIRIGIAAAGAPTIAMFEVDRPAGGLDVPYLHERILGEALGINEDAVREEKYITYVRGIDAALGEVENGAQVAFLLQPTTVEQVADVSFSGGVMPQKSTDFYPKLLSGLMIYPLEQ